VVNARAKELRAEIARLEHELSRTRLALHQIVLGEAVTAARAEHHGGGVCRLCGRRFLGMQWCSGLDASHRRRQCAA
jgi:hypothetical protein